MTTIRILVGSHDVDHAQRLEQALRRDGLAARLSGHALPTGGAADTDTREPVHAGATPLASARREDGPDLWDTAIGLDAGPVSSSGSNLLFFDARGVRRKRARTTPLDSTICIVILSQRSLSDTTLLELIGSMPRSVRFLWIATENLVWSHAPKVVRDRTDNAWLISSESKSDLRWVRDEVMSMAGLADGAKPRRRRDPELTSKTLVEAVIGSEYADMPSDLLLRKARLVAESHNQARLRFRVIDGAID
ncbi:MAG: hypothetical protein KGS44_16215 [Alphaproteobacteria bacterium]|nr:hypothetical protein [Alphaproteobacteria bacterium]